MLNKSFMYMYYEVINWNTSYWPLLKLGMIRNYQNITRSNRSNKKFSLIFRQLLLIFEQFSVDLSDGDFFTTEIR